MYETKEARRVTPFYYIATPYTKYKAGREQAFEDAAKAAAKFLDMGFLVYCPIAHTHPIEKYVEEVAVDDLDTWLLVDRPFMEAASGLFVVMMPGWEASSGVQREIETFKAAGKSVTLWDWPDLSSGMRYDCSYGKVGANGNQEKS